MLYFRASLTARTARQQGKRQDGLGPACELKVCLKGADFPKVCLEGADRRSGPVDRGPQTVTGKGLPQTPVLERGMGLAPSEDELARREQRAAAQAVEPITAEQFRHWKASKDAESAAAAAEAARKRAEDIAAGRSPMNGRELFEKEPWVFDDARFQDAHGA